MSEYPEHDKLKKVSAKSQAVGEFLDWLMNEKGVTLCVWHSHDDECACSDAWHEKSEVEAASMRTLGGHCPTCGSREVSRRDPTCHLATTYPNPLHRKIDDWLALYFEIDTDALEREKRAMLEKLREPAA